MSWGAVSSKVMMHMQAPTLCMQLDPQQGPRLPYNCQATPNDVQRSWWWCKTLLTAAKV